MIIFTTLELCIKPLSVGAASFCGFGWTDVPGHLEALILSLPLRLNPPLHRWRRRLLGDGGGGVGDAGFRCAAGTHREISVWSNGRGRPSCSRNDLFRCWRVRRVEGEADRCLKLERLAALLRLEVETRPPRACRRHRPIRRSRRSCFSQTADRWVSSACPETEWCSSRPPCCRCP
jgi:hypothetical protein